MSSIRENFLKYLELVNADLSDTTNDEEDLLWCKLIEYQGLDGQKILYNMVQKILPQHNGNFSAARAQAKIDLRKLAYLVLTRGTVYKKVVAKCTEDAKREVDKLIERYGVIKEGRPKSSIDLTLSRIAAVDPGQTAKAVIISRDISKFAPETFYHFPGGMGLVPQSRLAFCIESWTDWSLKFDRIINPNSQTPMTRERAKLYGMAAFNACPIPDATREKMFKDLENRWNKSSLPTVPKSPRRSGGGGGGGGGGSGNEKKPRGDDQPGDFEEQAPKSPRAGLGRLFKPGKQKSDDSTKKESGADEEVEKTVASRLVAPELSPEQERMMKKYVQSQDLFDEPRSPVSPQHYQIGTEPASSPIVGSSSKMEALEEEFSALGDDEKGGRAPDSDDDDDDESGAGGGPSISADDFAILRSIKKAAANWPLMGERDLINRVSVEYGLEKSASAMQGAPKVMKKAIKTEISRSLETNTHKPLPFEISLATWREVPEGETLPRSYETFKEFKVVVDWRANFGGNVVSTATGSPPPTNLKTLGDATGSNYFKDEALMSNVYVFGESLYHRETKMSYKSIELFVADCLAELDGEEASMELQKIVGSVVPMRV